MTGQTMYDSTDAAMLPAGAPLYAGYIDGDWPSAGAIIARFPEADVVTITVLGALGAKVADCEPGNLTPAAAANWADTEIRGGRRPTIYCDVADEPAVAAELAAWELAFGDQVDWWAADWTGVPHLVPGSVATQWESSAGYDTSLTDGVWPAPAASAPVPPSGTPGLSVEIVGMDSTPEGQGYWLVSAGGGVFNFGNAGHYGSLAGKTLDAPIVAIRSTPSGKGYWLTATDGGVFAFGDAKFDGSIPGEKTP